MTALLCVWHTRNDRYMLLRRAVLGYAKMRRTGPIMREVDMDKVFDYDYHITGLSWPLENTCDGAETCDQAAEITTGRER